MNLRRSFGLKNKKQEESERNMSNIVTILRQRKGEFITQELLVEMVKCHH